MNEFSGSKDGFLKRWFLRIMSFIGTIVTLGVLGVFFISNNEKNKEPGNVAHIKINRPIVNADESDNPFSDNDYISSDNIKKILKKVADKPEIKAILIEINSPGGTVVASEEIFAAIKDCPLPKLAWIRDIGTSGAYWAALGTDYIVAHPLSMTGSIGVIASSFGLEDLVQTLKIKYRRQIAGNMKDMGSPFREPTEEENIYMQNVLNQIHDEFITKFALERKLDRETALKLANGVFYTGRDALQNKMIDALGGEKEALLWLEQSIGTKPVLEKFGEKQNIFNSIFKGMNSIAMHFASAIGTGLGKSLRIKQNEQGLQI